MKEKNKGFTLVELLAVIVVLAVIMVIAGTSIINTINKNNADAFISTARVVYSTLKQCAASDLSSEQCREMVDINDEDYYLQICKDVDVKMTIDIWKELNAGTKKLVSTNSVNTDENGCSTTAKPGQYVYQLLSKRGGKFDGDSLARFYKGTGAGNKTPLDSVKAGTGATYQYVSARDSADVDKRGYMTIKGIYQYAE